MDPRWQCTSGYIGVQAMWNGETDVDQHQNFKKEHSSQTLEYQEADPPTEQRQKLPAL